MRANLREILRPIARFCVRRCLRLQETIEILKELLVDEARQELTRVSAEVSVSRIAAMTGVHRKDVSRLLKRGHNEEEFKVDLISRIIGCWRHDRSYCTKTGKPRLLSYEGIDSEFSELVRSVSQDLNPYAVMYELERAAAIEKTARGLRLTSRLYLIRNDSAAGFKVLSRDLDDLICAVEENVLEDPPIPNLHIRTSYNRVPIEQAEKIREWLIREGSELHARARAFLSKFDCDINHRLKPENGTARVVLTAFSWFEPESPPEKP